MFRRAAAEGGCDWGCNWATILAELSWRQHSIRSVGLFDRLASVEMAGYRKTGSEYFVNLEPFGERKKANT